MGSDMWIKQQLKQVSVAAKTQNPLTDISKNEAKLLTVPVLCSSDGHCQKWSWRCSYSTEGIHCSHVMRRKGSTFSGSTDYLQSQASAPGLCSAIAGFMQGRKGRKLEQAVPANALAHLEGSEAKPHWSHSWTHLMGETLMYFTIFTSAWITWKSINSKQRRRTGRHLVS